jgi:hypothetical protein
MASIWAEKDIYLVRITPSDDRLATCQVRQLKQRSILARHAITLMTHKVLRVRLGDCTGHARWVELCVPKRP